jgi:hypothetical protein
MVPYNIFIKFDSLGHTNIRYIVNCTNTVCRQECRVGTYVAGCFITAQIPVTANKNVQSTVYTATA